MISPDYIRFFIADVCGCKCKKEPRWEIVAREKIMIIVDLKSDELVFTYQCPDCKSDVTNTGPLKR